MYATSIPNGGIGIPPQLERRFTRQDFSVWLRLKIQPVIQQFFRSVSQPVYACVPTCHFRAPLTGPETVPARCRPRALPKALEFVTKFVDSMVVMAVLLESRIQVYTNLAIFARLGYTLRMGRLKAPQRREQLITVATKQFAKLVTTPPPPIPSPRARA